MLQVRLQEQSLNLAAFALLLGLDLVERPEPVFAFDTAGDPPYPGNKIPGPCKLNIRSVPWRP